MKIISNVLIKDLGSGIKKVIINDPKMSIQSLFLTIDIVCFGN